MFARTHTLGTITARHNTAGEFFGHDATPSGIFPHVCVLLVYLHRAWGDLNYLLLGQRSTGTTPCGVREPPWVAEINRLASAVVAWVMKRNRND